MKSSDSTESTPPSKKLLITEILLSSALVNILGLASSLYVMQVLNRYVNSGVDSTLATLTIGAVIAGLFEFFLRRLRYRVCVALQVPKDQTVGDSLFKSCLTAKYSVLDQLPQGEGRKAFSGLEMLSSAFSPNNILTIVDLPFALFYLGAVYMINTKLGLIVTGMLILSFSLGVFGGWRSGIATREMNNANAQVAVISRSVLTDIDTIRAFNGHSLLMQQWQKLNNIAQSFRIQLGQSQNLNQSLIQFSSFSLVILVIGFGAAQAVDGLMPIGTIIGVNILAGRALSIVSRFSSLVAVLMRSRESKADIDKVVGLPSERRDGAELATYKGQLEFRDVSFSYPEATAPIFESLSFTLKPGNSIIVTGGNGSGKSTIAKMIAWLVEPTRGEIFVDGVILSQVSADWWRKQLVYLPQEPTFLDGTIRDNLTTLNPEMDDEGLKNCMHRAGLKTFLDQLPDGLDTKIQNGGARLSVGIRRRLAMARALTTNGRLIVFDEPLSGMDQVGSRAVVQVMNEMLEQKHTMVICSHETAIAKNAQQILDLNVKPVPRLVLKAD
ncbi:MAG: ATP-binding cassette domain-containing protein [Magnetococcales bacterium]|nr:ATP-binding cassette domain-containing protein [Magnetococcales bacterium]